MVYDRISLISKKHSIFNENNYDSSLFFGTIRTVFLEKAFGFMNIKRRTSVHSIYDSLLLDKDINIRSAVTQNGEEISFESISEQLNYDSHIFFHFFDSDRKILLSENDKVSL